MYLRKLKWSEINAYVGDWFKEEIWFLQEKIYSIKLKHRFSFGKLMLAAQTQLQTCIEMQRGEMTYVCCKYRIDRSQISSPPRMRKALRPPSRTLINEQFRQTNIHKNFTRFQPDLMGPHYCCITPRSPTRGVPSHRSPFKILWGKYIEVSC